MRRKLRILVLVHPSLIPPVIDDIKKIDLEKVSFRTEYYVIESLKKLGHEVFVLGVDSDHKAIRKAKEKIKAHIAFNLLEQFDGDTLLDHSVVSYMELIKLKYTGCNPKGLMIARDKSLSKKLLYFHRIKTPRFAVARINKMFKKPKGLNFPLIVKSLTEEGSAGISQNSVVNDDQKLQERIKFIHEKIASDALVESFIEGKDIYVSMMGNKRITILPTIELAFKDVPDNIHQIATGRVKWSPGYRDKYKIELVIKDDENSEINKKIKKIAKRVFKILHLSGYVRLDLRVKENGEIFFIEANPNPDIAKTDEFALSAKKAGMNYEELLSKLLKLGL